MKVPALIYIDEKKTGNTLGAVDICCASPFRTEAPGAPKAGRVGSWWLLGGTSRALETARPSSQEPTDYLILSPHSADARVGEGDKDLGFLPQGQTILKSHPRSKLPVDQLRPPQTPHCTAALPSALPTPIGVGPKGSLIKSLQKNHHPGFSLSQRFST